MSKYIETKAVVDLLKTAIELIENPEMPNADLRLEYLQDYLNELEIIGWQHMRDLKLDTKLRGE